MIAADRLLQHRDAVAMLPAIVVLALLATASVKQIVKLKDTSEAITISLYEEPPEAAPEPPQPRVAPPEPRTPPRPEPRAVVVPTQEPVVAQAPQPAEAAPKPPPVPAPTAAQQPVAPPPSPTPVRAASETLESAYVAKLRTYLHSIKRYPTSREARLQRPQGRVRVWLEITRDGTLRDANVEESSGSMILDGAALSTVRQGSYPSFPEEMWAGKSTHRFAVTLEYTLDG